MTTELATLSSAQMELIGKGMSFPRVNDETRGTTRLSEGLERIEQSIRTILSTPIGSMAGNRRFGSKLNTMVFELQDKIFEDLATLYIKEALDLWEPRVTLVGVKVVSTEENIDGNVAVIRIRYKLKNSDTVSTLTYKTNQ